MTDRLNALVVVLDQDIRVDDAENIINAIRMIKHVATVTPNVADVPFHIATQRAKLHITGKLWDALKDT